MKLMMPVLCRLVVEVMLLGLDVSIDLGMEMELGMELGLVVLVDVELGFVVLMLVDVGVSVAVVDAIMITIIPVLLESDLDIN